MDNASKVKAMTAAKAGVEAGGEGRRRRPGTEARQVNQGMLHRRTAEGMADCWPGLSCAVHNWAALASLYWPANGGGTGNANAQQA